MWTPFRGARRQSAGSAFPFYEQSRTTLMFNGYTDQVGSMYAGMDLKRYY